MKVRYPTLYKKDSFRPGVSSCRIQRPLTNTDYERVNSTLNVNPFLRRSWLLLDKGGSKAKKLSHNSNHTLAVSTNDHWSTEMCKSLPNELNGLLFIGLPLISWVCLVIWKKIFELCHAGWMKLNPKSSLKYEDSFFKCLEGPIICYMNYMTIVHLLALVSPSIVLKYGIQIEKGVGITLYFWLLLELKHFIFKWALEKCRKIDDNMKTSYVKSIASIQRWSSIVLIAIGYWTLLEVIGIPILSLVSLQAICGSLASIGLDVVQKEIGSGFYPEYSDKFTIDNNIKGAALERKIIVIAAMIFQLLANSRIPFVAPNSQFSDSEVDNKSRVEYESTSLKIKCKICNLDDYEKLPKILDDIRKMIISDKNGFIVKDIVPPHVFTISSNESSIVEINIFYNIKKMREDLFCEAKQSIASQVIAILKGNNIKGLFLKSQ